MTEERIANPLESGGIPEEESRPRTQARITIHDVARLANVSVSTVSKALNRSGSLRQETRDRVIAVARELGFRPNDLAQSLHRGQSLTVGLISTDSFGRFTIPIMEGLEECLADRRMGVFMCNATDDPEREAQHVEQLIGKRVDGIVVTARRADRRPKLEVPSPGIPVIYVFSQSDDPESLCLLPDDEGGAVLATQHLASLGRRRIAHVTGPERFEAVRLRRDGYRKALTGAGLDEPEGFYLPGVWSEGWGREAVAHLFRARRAPPDAIFCGNDQIARGISDALRERGIAVPDGVSIVGFDNWEIIAEATRPPLTTIDMNLSDLGREAGRRLIRMIAGEHMRGVHRLPCSLIVRDSCGARSGRVAGEDLAVSQATVPLPPVGRG
jgi:LacI family transcriptional regulator